MKHDTASVVSLKRTGMLPGQSRFVIGLRQHYTDEDAWVLTRILASKEAWTGATLLHNNMMRHSLNNDPLPMATVFSSAGHTALQARCKRLQSGDDRWRSLCCAPFSFETLVIDRDNSRPPTESDLSDAEKTSAFGPSKNRSVEYQGKDLQSRNEPNNQCSIKRIPVPSSRFDAIAGREGEKPLKSECRYANRLIQVETAASKELWTRADENNCSVIGPGKVITHYQRRKSLLASFQTFVAAIEALNMRPDFTAKIRESDPLIEFVPLTKLAGKRQWSYLYSSKHNHRLAIIADICYQQKWYSIIKSEQRQNGKKSATLICESNFGYVSSLLIKYILQASFQKNEILINISFSGNLDVGLTTMKHTWVSATHCASKINELIAI